jgi:hypothetical protein
MEVVATRPIHAIASSTTKVTASDDAFKCEVDERGE